MIPISVVIPTYNRNHTLKRAIDSVLRQTYKNFELIVVDDGSTDKTVESLSCYKEKIHLIKLGKNHGVSLARNVGIHASKGEYVCFLDSDDEWLEDKLQRQVNLLSQKKYNLIHGEEIWIRNGKRVNQKKIHQKYGGWIFEKCLPRCLISPSAAMANKKVLLELGGFDEEFPVCEDYDLWAKITSRYEVGFIEGPPYHQIRRCQRPTVKKIQGNGLLQDFIP